MEAITRCPACRTSFLVTEAQLRIADGSVRCGACRYVFQAEDHFLSPPETAEPGSEMFEQSSTEDSFREGGSSVAGMASEVPAETAEPTDFDFDFNADPDHLLQDQRRFFPVLSPKRLPGILLLLLTLGIQWVYLNLATLSQDVRYREHILTVCRIAGCQVPDYDNPDLLHTRELIIRTHPEEPLALTVDVLLRNRGSFRQAFPGLRLDFMDARGNLVASRVFQADEYLGGEMRGLRYIPALTEVRLSLEIVDPGGNALGYQMEVVRI